MAQTRICGVYVRIGRDPNSELYYIYLEYRKEKELPILLGKSIQPEVVYRIIMGFLGEKKIKCRTRILNDGIAQLIQKTFNEMGIVDQKTLDLKLFKWGRTTRK